MKFFLLFSLTFSLSVVTAQESPATLELSDQDRYDMLGAYGFPADTVVSKVTQRGQVVATYRYVMKPWEKDTPFNEAQYCREKDIPEYRDVVIMLLDPVTGRERRTVKHVICDPEYTPLPLSPSVNVLWASQIR